jgi:hypothetical protein
MMCPLSRPSFVLFFFGGEGGGQWHVLFPTRFVRRPTCSATLYVRNPECLTETETGGQADRHTDKPNRDARHFMSSVPSV